MQILLYCTKSRWQLFKDIITGKWLIDKIKNKNAVNGKIVGECEFELEEIERFYCFGEIIQTKTMCFQQLLGESCLDEEELVDYLEGENGYAIHFKNLNIFDEPKELSNYHISYYNKELKMMREKHLEKAPQNMCRIFDENGTYILISIRPERLCKILNGEKTIEVRKKVLKEML